MLKPEEIELIGPGDAEKIAKLEVEIDATLKRNHGYAEQKFSLRDRRFSVEMARRYRAAGWFVELLDAEINETAALAIRVIHPDLRGA